MSLDIDLRDVRAYAAQVKTAGGRIGRRGSQVLRKVALDIERDAKILAPYEFGVLQGSISSTFTGDGRNSAMSAEVGPTAHYGIYQEFGTSTHAAQPFLGPAFDRHAPGFNAAIGQLAAEELT